MPEEDDETNTLSKTTKPSRDSVRETAAFLQSMQLTAEPSPQITSTPANSVKKDLSPHLGPKAENPRIPSKKTSDVPPMFDLTKRGGHLDPPLPQTHSDSTHQTLDNNVVSARPPPSTKTTNDVWVKSESMDTALKYGQSGKWYCFSDAPYTSQKHWVFLPDRIPAPKQKAPRPKRRKSQPKATTDFLSLPGELRNEVYKHLIPECRILITCNKPNKELAKAREVWSEQEVEHKRPHPRLYHLLDLHQAEKGLGITKCLLSACKQLRNDVELYLYSRTTFCFSSTKALHRFLNTASKPGLRAIRKVEILHMGYGIPALTEHQQFRDKYYERWSKSCIKVGQELSGLEHLKLEAHMRDWPCDLASAAPHTLWRKACLQMAPRRLRKVEVKLFHHMIHRNDMVLKELARRLENDMMSQDGQNERDLLETEKVLEQLAAKKAAKEARTAARAAKRLAPKSLTISQEVVKQSKSTPVKICKKAGLGDYSKVNTSQMCVAELHYFKDQYCSERHKAG